MNELKPIVMCLVAVLILAAFIDSARGQDVSIPDPGLNAAIRGVLATEPH